MGYHGAKLRNVFDPEPGDLGTRQIAEDVGDAGLALVIEHTPVDTGHLKSSFKKTATRRFTDDPVRRGWRSGFETNVEYAPYVEWGTGTWPDKDPEHPSPNAKYPIRPKKPDGVLHWVNDAGDDVFAKLVMHPGSEGAHMAALAVAGCDAALGGIGEAGTLLWERLQTAVWDKEAARARIEIAARRFA